jgi:hypothetical protein
MQRTATLRPELVYCQLPYDSLKDGPRYPQRPALAPVDKHAGLVFKQTDNSPARVVKQPPDFGHGIAFGVIFISYHLVITQLKTIFVCTKL